MFHEEISKEVNPLLKRLIPDWPEPVTYAKFKTQPVEQPFPIVENLLDGSSRMIFGGGSKTYKTWAMSDMALSINAGVPWWGFNIFQAQCIYVNFELKEFYMKKRLVAIERAKQLDCRCNSLLIWNLRGYEVPLAAFRESLIEKIRANKIIIVFIDPFYKLLGGKDERVSADLNPILAAFDDINRLTGATVVFSAHFTKGNQAGKESMDRISGGGSINRDPDSLMTLTKHEEEGAFVVDFTVRDFAPISPFVVRWEYPLLVRTDLDPTKLKQVQRGRPACDPEDLFLIIEANDDELSTKELIAKAVEKLAWSERTVRNKLDFLKLKKRVRLSIATDKWNVR